MKWLLTAAVAVVAAASCRRVTPPPVAGEASLADSAEQIMLDVHSALTNLGVKRGDLYADTVYVFNDQTRFVMRRVRATFNTETGAPNGTLTGDRGTYDLRSQVLEGFGNVIVTNTEGNRLVSNHLKFMQATNQVTSDSAFTLTKGKDVQQGIGFNSDPNITRFQCLRACRGSAVVPLNTFPNR